MRGGERSEAGGFAPKISILRMRNVKKKNENDSRFNYCFFFSGTGETYTVTRKIWRNCFLVFV